MSRWNVRLWCSACGNRTTVNLERFNYRRIELLREAIGVMDCGVCKAKRVTGVVTPGFAPDAQMTLDSGKPLTWTDEAVAEAAVRAKQKGDGT